MHSVLSGYRARTRRGAATVFVAISMVFILGFAALAVDISALYSAQSELQRTADASALAAATALSSGGTSQDEAIDLADEAAVMNAVMRVSAGLDSNADVEFGRANAGPDGRFTFAAGGTPIDAVRVTVRRSQGSRGGSIAVAFGGLMGVRHQDLQARAAAVLIPRDMALSVDLSGSMAWDSSLLFWNRNDGGYANTRDVWAALDGPEPSRPYEPGVETATEYAGDTGPAVGWMTNWGNPLIPGTYSPGSDSALWYIRKGQNTSNTTITTRLTAAGYSSDERSIIMSASKDSTASHWRYRCGIMLGLCSWRSGRSGGIPGGDGDNNIESSEITWIGYPSWRGTWTWTNYIDFVQGGQYNDAANFRYLYGLKTFMHMLLENYRSHNDTSVLWATPEMPQRAIKDAVQAMVDELENQSQKDHLSLEVFATTALHEVNLTDDYQSIADTLYARQAGHYDQTTNIGGGLQQAIAELKSGRARENARKIIILLSDGVPNIDQAGVYVGDGASSAMEYCRVMAQQAADEGFTVHTVSVGSYADRGIMQEIAQIGGGLEFYAAGNPDEYKDELENIFRSLGGNHLVQLIE